MVADPASKKLSSVPFPAIVGQDDLKRVLLLAAAHDDLSGAVITGEKGTAKSTAVRGLVDLLPEQQAVADCPYGCAPDDPASQCAECRAREADDLPVETRQVPLVTLPLGATRDRVVGTLSVEDAMAGDAEFDPGLLAASSTSTRSICWTTTSSTCCSMPPPAASTRSNATGSASPTLPSSRWSGR